MCSLADARARLNDVVTLGCRSQEVQRPHLEASGVGTSQGVIDYKEMIDEKDTQSPQCSDAQMSCSDKFRCGHSLQDLIEQLRSKETDPMTDDFLIINVIQASVRFDRRSYKEVWYTLDHRRLKCMKDAGCTECRVRIVMANDPALNQFVNKSKDSLGLRADIQVDKWR